MPELAVILVNYRRPDDTIECVRSLRQSTFTDFRLIIVDNASGDGSVERLRNDCPEALLIAHPTNLGFAEGNNAGIRVALAEGAQLVLLLNNDTIVDPDALHVLVRTMEDHYTAGIVGAKIRYYDRKNILWFAGGYINRHSTFGGHYGLNTEDRGQFDTLRSCDFVTGCTLLFRRALVDQVGMLERSYFAYLEDVEFCVRAGDAGYDILYQPGAIIYHKVSSTSSWDSPVYIYFNLRNKIIFLRRNSSVLRWLPHLPHLAYFYLRQFARLVFKWHDIRGTRAAWLGLRDGLRNFTGSHGEGSLDRIVAR